MLPRIVGLLLFTFLTCLVGSARADVFIKPSLNLPRLRLDLAGSTVSAGATSRPPSPRVVYVANSSRFVATEGGRPSHDGFGFALISALAGGVAAGGALGLAISERRTFSCDGDPVNHTRREAAVHRDLEVVGIAGTVALLSLVGWAVMRIRNGRMSHTRRVATIVTTVGAAAVVGSGFLFGAALGSLECAQS